METIEISLSGNGKLFHIYPIMKPSEYRKTMDISEMLSREIIAPAIEVAALLNHTRIKAKGRRIIKSKGPYYDDFTYFIDKLPIPYVAFEVSDIKVEQTFQVQISGDTKFRAKNLRLIRSKHDVPFLDYGIIPTEIVYGSEIIKGDRDKPYEVLSTILYPHNPIYDLQMGLLCKFDTE